MLTIDQIEKLKFPIGPFVPPPAGMSKMDLDVLIRIVEEAPIKYQGIANTLSADDLKKTYREGSWNVQQLFNHVADMQMLHFFRMKKALTETDYRELTLVDMSGWAATPDGSQSPVEDALQMFESITKRYVRLMRSLDEAQHNVTYYHPVRKIHLNQKQAIGMSAWHVRHHLEHLKIALQSSK
jgi:hypothetical protein